MNRILFIAIPVASAMIAMPAAAADGKAVWEKNCAGCHAMLAPKADDKAAWAPFVKQGPEAVAVVVIKGKGAMPPKGGAATEEEAKAAVAYILDHMK